MKSIICRFLLPGPVAPRARACARAHGTECRGHRGSYSSTKVRVLRAFSGGVEGTLLRRPGPADLGFLVDDRVGHGVAPRSVTPDQCPAGGVPWMATAGDSQGFAPLTRRGSMWRMATRRVAGWCGKAEGFRSPQQARRSCLSSCAELFLVIETTLPATGGAYWATCPAPCRVSGDSRTRAVSRGGRRRPRELVAGRLLAGRVDSADGMSASGRGVRRMVTDPVLTGATGPAGLCGVGGAVQQALAVVEVVRRHAIDQQPRTWNVVEPRRHADQRLRRPSVGRGRMPVSGSPCVRSRAS